MTRRRLFSIVLALTVLAPALAQANDSQRTVRSVRFVDGATRTTIQGQIRGYQVIDYQVHAAAGQTMTVTLSARHPAAYFNLLPPQSQDSAMRVGSLDENHFTGLLPDDGVYTIRVYLMRAAARRQESSAFSLDLSITGKPLIGRSSNVDAVLPGTRFHAKATIPCAPLDASTRECEAFVIRRGFDGTATVEVRWDSGHRRRILFVEGEPRAADIAQPMTFTRQGGQWRILFNAVEYFEIPEALVFGG